MVGDGNAGSRSLGVVDQGVDAPKCGDCLVHYMLNNGLVVLTGRDVCLDGEDLDAVLGLKGFLGGLEFGDVATGNYQVGALFGESDVDAVAD